MKKAKQKDLDPKKTLIEKSKEASILLIMSDWGVSDGFKSSTFKMKAFIIHVGRYWLLLMEQYVTVLNLFFFYTVYWF